MTTDPIAAARALIAEADNPRVHGLLMTARGLRDMVATLADALEAERAENQRLREALEQIAQLAGAVGIDLQGRVESGKVIAVLNCQSIARAALRNTEASHDD